MHPAANFEDLLKAVAARDIAAFRKLYDVTLARLSLVARLITGDATLTDDVLQIAYFKIWEKAPQFDPQRGSSIGWLLRICRNTAIDEVRKQRLALSRETNDFSDCAVDEGFADDRPGDWLGRLPPEQADALLSVYELGLTHAELADKLKLPLGTVKSRVRRALIAAREFAQ
ncbi:MAG: sigma-70 family RNA polymerase sigma factor [Rhodospirillaceae bacterium]|nr:sigma-70 family RNA polymerase sigma factor [Rhodospirillaceae bacterium]